MYHPMSRYQNTLHISNCNDSVYGSSNNVSLSQFVQYCDQYPDLVRQSLLVYKTWMRIGNGDKIPYIHSTLEECLEWFATKVNN